MSEPSQTQVTARWRPEGTGGGGRRGRREMSGEGGGLDWGGEHATQHTDAVLQVCTPETHVMFPPNVTPRKSVFKNRL